MMLKRRMASYSEFICNRFRWTYLEQDLGNSKQKYLYLPEPHNDFIFAVLAEEVRICWLCGCYSFICNIYLERNINCNESSRYVWKLSCNRNNSFSRNTSYNKYSSCNISIPATGMPLPFFSYGGTALIILLCAVGVLLNISRQSQKNN